MQNAGKGAKGPVGVALYASADCSAGVLLISTQKRGGYKIRPYKTFLALKQFSSFANGIDQIRTKTIKQIR